MMVARHWQQRRTGKVRRRLHYTNFMIISEDHHAAFVVGRGDSSQSCHDNFGEVLLPTASASLTREETSALGSSSPSAVLASEDGTDAVSSDTKNRMVDSVADIPYFEKALQYKKSSSLSIHQDLGSQQLGRVGATQVNVSVKLTTKRDNTMKDEEQEQRRGTRKRKPKVPYEEETTSRKPQKKLRQMRIMRHLGLAAPHGSPFISNCVVRTAA